MQNDICHDPREPLLRRWAYALILKFPFYSPQDIFDEAAALEREENEPSAGRFAYYTEVTLSEIFGTLVGLVGLLLLGIYVVSRPLCWVVSGPRHRGGK